MPEDESNRTLLDFEPSNDDDATDDGCVAEEDDGEPGTEEDDGVADDGDGDPEVGEDGWETVVRDVASVSPAVSTSRFAPEGEPCAACETSTQRLWLVDGDAVCADCKSW